MTLPGIDFETYSEAGYVWNGSRWGALEGAPSGKNRFGLGCVGVAVYAEHPSTEVLCLNYGEGRTWKPGQPAPEPLFLHLEAGGLLAAWNAPFEWWIWNTVCTKRYNWPRLPLRQLRCSAARARAYSLPPSLAGAGEALWPAPPSVAPWSDDDIPF